MIYDEEQMIRDIETLFKNNLNAEIACVNQEKSAVSGDTLFLEDIPTEKYIFETLDSRILNYKGFFVMFGLIDTPPRDANLESFINDVTVTFQVATFDKGDKHRSNTLYKLLRYRQALQRVIMKNPEVFRSYAKPLVSSLRPDAFPYDNRKVILTIGLNIQASVTAN